MSLMSSGCFVVAFVVVAAQSGAVPPAQSGGASGAPPAQILAPGSTQLVGRIVEAGTQTGVPGAVVVLNGPLGPTTAMFSNGIPGGPRRMTADAQGQFLFRDLPPGSYTIASTAAGYVDGLYGETRTITIRRSLDLTRSLELTETDKLITAQVLMWKLGGISGRVLDENGEPLVGAPVSVIARMTDWGGPVMEEATTVPTDDRGVYHVDVVPGDYVVGVQMATSTTPISVVEGYQQASSEGPQALGRYMDQIQASGAFLARGVGVRVGNWTVGLRRNILTGLPPIVSLQGKLMQYPTAYHPSSTSPASAGLVTVQSGEEKAGIDIRMQLIPARRVSGRVTGPDGPAPGLAVLLIPADPAVMRMSPATIIDTPQTITDANGAFTFIGVAPGSYILRSARPEGSAATPLLWAVESVAVAADSDLDGLQVMLKPGVRVNGRFVVESASMKSMTPQQMRGISVMARPIPGSSGAIIGTTLRAATDHPDDTHFVSSQTAPGPHMITVTGIPGGWVLKSVTSAGQNIVDKSFDLSASGLSDVVVTLTDAISSITGIARDGAGKPAPAATVAVFPADRALWRIPGMASRRVLTAAPARDGRYSFRGLPAGDYIIVAAEWPTADFSDGRVLATLMADGTRVTLADGGSVTQDLRVVKR